MIIIAFLFISVLGFCNYWLWCEIEKTKSCVMSLIEDIERYRRELKNEKREKTSL